MEDRELLDALLCSTQKLSEVKILQESLSKEVAFYREKMEKHGEDIAVLETSLKSLETALDGERKLNRDRQVDFSKLLDDKMESIYRMATIIAFIISLLVSVLPIIFR